MLNSFTQDEKITDNIVGFEVLDIDIFKESDIPDLPALSEKYDVVDTDMKDMTIREIVLMVQEEYWKRKRESKRVA